MRRSLQYTARFDCVWVRGDIGKSWIEDIARLQKFSLVERKGTFSPEPTCDCISAPAAPVKAAAGAPQGLP
jgi:hypothetical protein